MRKYISFALALICMLTLAGCNGGSMGHTAGNEPSITGIVKEVRDNSVLIYIQTDGYPYGADCNVSLDVENAGSYTDISVGDEVVMYYDGYIAETNPLQINNVYDIALKSSAKQADE